MRRQVGMVFQKPNPFPGLSIFDNVAVGLKLMGIKGKELSEKVELSLRQAVLWDEVKDILKRPGYFFIWRDSNNVYVLHVL